MTAADFEWSDLRFFLAVARTGKLVAAAQALAVEHFTVSRRIAALERALGIHQMDSQQMSVPGRWVRRLVTFHLVCLGWIFFRCPTFGQAFQVIWRILTWSNGQSMNLTPLACLVAIIALQTAKLRIDFHQIFLRRPTFSRWIVYASVGFLFIVLSMTRSPEFIYFQF